MGKKMKKKPKINRKNQQQRINETRMLTALQQPVLKGPLKDSEVAKNACVVFKATISAQPVPQVVW